MSHFALHVLIPKPKSFPDGLETYATGQIERLLAPFNEALDVAPYMEPCYCVGRKAKREVNDAVIAKFGDWEAIRLHFKIQYPELANVDYLDPETDQALIARSRAVWAEQFSRPPEKMRHEAFEAHPLKDLVDANCEECKGSGQVESTYNPNSQWDWYVIGGRWNGSLVGHDPESDPENMEDCFCCNGTGTRPGGEAQFGAAWVKQMKGCNGCMGKGKMLKMTSQQKSVGNILLLSEFLPKHSEKNTPFAVLTPTGEWHECGEMGWWGIVSDEKDKSQWVEQVGDLYRKFPDTILVLVDCHI